MKQLGAVIGVLWYCQMTTAGQVFLAITIGLPVAIEIHSQGMARLRRAGLAAP